MRFDIGVSVKIRDAYAARHEPEAQHVLANFYWAFLVILCALSLLSAVFYGAWEFTRPLAEESGSSVTVGVRKVLSRTDIQKVLEALDSRAGLFDERRTAPAVRDPS
jgi:preprotein translocase subunit SecF